MSMLLEIKNQFPSLVFLFPQWNTKKQQLFFQIGNTFERAPVEVSWHEFCQHPC